MKAMSNRDHEPEWAGPAWKHPYAIYPGITGALFLFLLLMAWLAWSNDWIPHR